MYAVLSVYSSLFLSFAHAAALSFVLFLCVSFGMWFRYFVSSICLCFVRSFLLFISFFL